MISIICTTDRTDSNSIKISQVYKSKLDEMGEISQIFDLGSVPAQLIQQSSYVENTPEFDKLSEKYIRGAERLIFITPEYNGSFPGYLKFFMDACDHKDFVGRKVALMGLASGRSGNVRGLDHLTGILHYLGAEVYSSKVYLSQIGHFMTTEGELDIPFAEAEIEAQLKGFVTF